MVVRGREFIVDTIVFGRDRDGRVGLVERVHDLLSHIPWEGRGGERPERGRLRDKERKKAAQGGTVRRAGSGRRGGKGRAGQGSKKLALSWEFSSALDEVEAAGRRLRVVGASE